MWRPVNMIDENIKDYYLIDIVTDMRAVSHIWEELHSDIVQNFYFWRSTHLTPSIGSLVVDTSAAATVTEYDAQIRIQLNFMGPVRARMSISNFRNSPIKDVEEEENDVSLIDQVCNPLNSDSDSCNGNPEKLVPLPPVVEQLLHNLR